MLIINITLGPISKEQKEALIKRMTEVSMEITNAPEASHLVAITELPLDALGLGKKTVEAVINEKK